MPSMPGMLINTWRRDNRRPSPIPFRWSIWLWSHILYTWEELCEQSMRQDNMITANIDYIHWLHEIRIYKHTHSSVCIYWYVWTRGHFHILHTPEVIATKHIPNGWAIPASFPIGTSEEYPHALGERLRKGGVLRWRRRRFERSIGAGFGHAWRWGMCGCWWRGSRYW